MNILITGATSFIGSPLALRCLEEGHDVRAMGNTPGSENANLLQEKGADVIIGSVTDQEFVDRAHKGIDLVFHLAAAQHEADVPDQHFWNVNVEGTQNVLAASAAVGVRRFVHIGTTAVYGAQPGTIINSDSSLKPDNIYGKTKLAGEKAVRSHETDEIPWVVARPTEVYGPGDRRLLKLFRGVNEGWFPIIGSGENLHHPVYIDDVVDGLMKSAREEKAVGETFVLPGPRSITTKEMVAAVAHALDTEPPRWHIPMTPIMLMAKAMDWTLRPLGISPPVHPRRMGFYRKNLSFDIDKARSLINYEPKVGLEEGIRATAQWYEKQGLL